MTVAGSLIPAAEEEAVDPVWVLTSCSVEESAGESISTTGVSRNRREEKIEVFFIGAVSGEICCC